MASSETEQQWKQSPAPDTIAGLRVIAGWTIQEAAAALRVAHSTFWRWQTGKSAMPLAAFELMCMKVSEETGKNQSFSALLSGEYEIDGWGVTIITDRKRDDEKTTKKRDNRKL